MIFDTTLEKQKQNKRINKKTAGKFPLKRMHRNGYGETIEEA